MSVVLAKPSILGIADTSALVANLASTVATSAFVAKPDTSGIADTSALAANLVSTSVTLAKPSIEGSSVFLA